VAQPDYSSPQARAASKSPGAVPIPIGTMANISAVACNISGLTPSQRAARDK
jgi:hypothetical protein